ncbi:hypothetical protein GX50_01477 [[Emmonsia] crescens]|uniref:Uncharacterized protein n=1 Tax=[Emmonsia] crescens TaxID=73230 RepID=A0A2B7ZR20_9EURO|nr:hypothetical protein GX50_01477 [Emmonsia crescens]
MPFTTYDASVGLIIMCLKSLEAILAQAEEHAKSKEINPDEYVEAKLYEDMKSLDFQVRVTVETATKCASRLLGDEPQEWKEETTFAGLRKQTADAIAILNKVNADSVEGKEANTITMGIGPGKTKSLLAKDYVTGYSLPNVFFHLQTAYCILRHKGVPLTKSIFLTPFLS